MSFFLIIDFVKRGGTICPSQHMIKQGLLGTNLRGLKTMANMVAPTWSELLRGLTYCISESDIKKNRLSLFLVYPAFGSQLIQAFFRSDCRKKMFREKCETGDHGRDDRAGDNCSH